MTGATTAQNDSYAWDSVGNLTSIADKAGNASNWQTACYAYDDYQRLIRAVTVAGAAGTECTTLPTGAGTGVVPWSYTYALDSAGGLTSAKDEQSAITTAYAYPASGSTPHLPSSITVTGSAAQTVTPDGAGRVTAIGATTLTWDPFGMNATASSGGVTTTSAYTADGMRVARTDSTGSTTLYLPDQEITKTGSTLSYTRYIHHGGTTVAVRTSNTTVSINASDIQGSAAITINATNVVSRRYATPYGAQITSTGGTLPGQRRFLGHVQDPTGIVDDAARVYQPSVGMFLSPDPLAAASPVQASNAYGYGAANPTSFTDPSGLMIGGDRGTGTTDDPMIYVAAAGRAGNPDWTPKKARDGAAGLLNGAFKSLQDAATAGDGLAQRFGGPLGWLAAARDNAWDHVHSFLEQHGGADTSATNYQNATSDGAAGVTLATMFVGGAGVGKVAKFASAFVRPCSKAAAAADGAGIAKPWQFVRTEALSGRASSRDVAKYAESMRADGWQGPPIKTVRLDGDLYVVDGHHRLAAAKRAGIDVPYEVVDPSDVIGPGAWSSIDDILQDAFSVGPDRIR